MKKILDQLKNPSKEYRPIPFWSWNDKLDPEFLKWQIGEMDMAGLGGYFMHARGGLETEYLSDEWMECIKAGADEGSKRGMKPWVYDEAGWPSGFAGGLVTALGDGYHARGLSMNVLESISGYDFDDKVLGIYLYDEKSKALTLADGKSAAQKQPDGLNIIVIKHTAGPYYIDVLNEAVVKAFIQYTHERYHELLGSKLGEGLQGFFTDEPRLSEGDIPWSYILPDKFYQKYGYDIIPELPKLFIKADGYEKVRYDFWALVSELFVNAFMKQIYDWCDEHNCKLTGHVMMEESIYSQMTGTAGSMPFYEYMHIPGVDWLRRMIGSPVVPKQVSSVACQLGKQFVLTESFALSGWDVSFEELKWMVEWQYVNGVNLLCQHLQGYTLRGLRKRDYPPSLFFQQPWWKEYPLFNDYVSRLGLLLSSGTPSAEVLLLHPMKSGWITYDGGNNAEIKKLDADFIKASELLSGIHADYHYGDETIIGKYGRVEKDRFIVGKCAYRAVILPSMATIDKRTAELLLEFIKFGGLVASVGEFPALCNGRRDPELLSLKELIENTGCDQDKVMELLKKKHLDSVRISADGTEIADIRYQQRHIDGEELFFLVNLSAQKRFDAVVSIAGRGELYLIDAENVTENALKFEHRDGRTLTELSFLPMQSYILVMKPEGSGHLKEAKAVEESVVVKPGREWVVEASDINALTLDYCSYSIDGGGWEGPVPVIKLMDILLEMKRKCDIALKFEFYSEKDFSKSDVLQMAVENAGEFAISVNGVEIEYKDIGWWKDSAFKKVDIRPFVKPGRNEITLRRCFCQSQKVYDVLFGENVYETELNKLTYDVELESIYIIGDFGVISKDGYQYGERKAVFTQGPFILTEKPSRVKTGDLTTQGYCFFAGAIKLGQKITVNRAEGKRVLLDIGRPNAVTTGIYINGRKVRMLSWTPYLTDITDYVTDGENTLSVELFSGNRNLLGPHHHINGELYNVGPMSFSGKWSWCERPTEAVETDDRDRTKNYWKEGYCFVKFGLEE